MPLNDPWGHAPKTMFKNIIYQLIISSYLKLAILNLKKILRFA